MGAGELILGKGSGPVVVLVVLPDHKQGRSDGSTKEEPGEGARTRRAQGISFDDHRQTGPGNSAMAGRGGCLREPQSRVELRDQESERMTP